MEKKTGKLIKTNRGWEVEYEEKVPQLHFLAKQTVAIPLHPDSIKKLNMSNVNLELEFEIVDEIIDLGRHGSTIVQKAKLISPKQEELPNELSKVTRLEVIDHSPQGEGRAYIQRGIKELN